MIIAYKVFAQDLDLLSHLAHEWRLLLNLFGLLIGFAMLARHFEDSGVPELLPRWGLLAFAVGYGGSMIWFGSSAGIAISTIFPEAKNTWRWLKEGWHVPVAYVLGFFTLLWILGWQPDLLGKL